MAAAAAVAARFAQEAPRRSPVACEPDCMYSLSQARALAQAQARRGLFVCWAQHAGAGAMQLKLRT